jgi:uncharacterized protein YidB (DUF937 family)
MNWIKSLFSSAKKPAGAEAPHASHGESRAVLALIEHYVDSNGGLANVVKNFEAAGFVSKVRSWISAAPNQPINSVEALQLFGLNALRDMAKKAGIPVERLRDLMAELLPLAIDKATPGGKLPAA